MADTATVDAATARLEIRVIGKIWQPGFDNVAYDYSPRVQPEDGPLYAGDFPLPFTRETVDDWLTRNAGDFQSITDFEATISWHGEVCQCCGQVVVKEETIPWESEESDIKYGEAMFGTDE